ncbi:MAG: hypothetical protein AB1405_01995 [Bdellovibrionota bacterium]
MDVAFCLAFLRPAPQYFGCLDPGTIASEFGGDPRAAYEKIRWHDPRPKPTWEEIEAAWPEAQKQIEAEGKKERLAATDGGMMRLSEDLVDALLRKGVIAETDLPTEAVAKLQERRTLREGISSKPSRQP